MASLTEGETSFRNLVQELPDAVIVTDIAGVVQFCNQAAERFFGQRAGELEGQSLDLDFDSESAVEVRVVADDGTLRHGEALTTAIDWAGLPAYLVSLRDVTAKRRAESMHRALVEQKRHSERIEAVNRVAASVGHGFNEQLTAIRSYADFLLHHVPEGDPAREDVTAIDEAVRQAATLAQQLLSLSRAHSLRPVVLDARAAIHDLTTTLHRLLPPNVRLRMDLASDTGSILFDPSQMGQVIASVASTACETMPNGGELAIYCDRVAIEEARAQGLGLPTTDLVRITVSDDGAGMDEQMLSQLFEPRFTAPNGVVGETGLATVYGIIKQSRGAITVYSEPGRGTRFEIFLPRSSQSAMAEEDAASGLAPNGETVLLVEDEEIVRRAASRALREHGYQVLEARFGVDALEVESSHDGPIHLLLTDVVMPGMSGPELAAQMRERRPGVGVVYMSGYADDHALRHDSEQHVLVQKPFPIPKLMQTLRSVLERRSATA